MSTLLSHSRLRLFACLPSLLLPLLLSVPGMALAQRVCVFDPLGAQGDYFGVMRDYQIAMQREGISLELKPYTDETIAVEDFKAGQCEMMNMTGLRARQFNMFSGSIDAVGGIENYAELRDLLQVMSSPKLAHLMVGNGYEIGGVFPIGAGYPFVKDRSINTLGKAAGKKIAVMEWDRTEAMLVEQVGAQPVASDITNYGAKFNNGAVDIIIAPIVLYKPFELSKGLGAHGGIVRRAVLELTMQLVMRPEKFPAGFGQKSREYVASQLDRTFGMIRNLENQVDPRHWMYGNTAYRDDYYKQMREARIHLAKDGFFDRRMLSIMKRIRCKSDPTSGECALPDE